MVDKSRMTSAVTVGYLLVILFFYPSYAAFLDLGYSHIHGLSTTESGNDLGDYSSTTDWIRLHPRYSCHQCEPPNCEPDVNSVGVCCYALFCYKSSVRASDGIVHHSRGCIKRVDFARIICRTSQHPFVVRKRDDVQLSIRCCQNDMCNDGTFPNLPPAHRETAVQPLLSNNCNFWNK